MSALDRLAEIEQRANRSERLVTLCGYCDAGLLMACTCATVDPRESISELITDNRSLVAALRAVLGNHWCIEGGEECGYDGRSWPCPDYRAITEALGGGE